MKPNETTRPTPAANPDAKALAARGILYERNGFYVRKARNGFEVYEPSASSTHATRCAVIGYAGDYGLARAIAETDRRAANASQPSPAILAALLLSPVRASSQTLTPAQWFARLSEHFPAAYIDARGPDFVRLYAEGSTVGCAAIYAIVHLLGPEIAFDSDPTEGNGRITP